MNDDPSGARDLPTLVRRHAAAGAAAAAVPALGFAAFYAIDLGTLAVGWVLALATGAFVWRPANARETAIRLALLLSVAAVGVGTVGLRVMTVLAEPGPWDFLCYFLDGKVVLSGLDPYAPDSHRRVFQTLSTPVAPDIGFEQGVLNVGMKYPPPSMLVVAPFGLMDFETGLAVWMTVIVVLPAALAAWLVRGELVRHGGAWVAWAFAVALVTLSPGGSQTVATQQTLYVCLCVLLLMRRFGGAWSAGLVAALGIPFKTLLIIGPLVLVVAGHWRAFLVSVVALAALFGGTVLLFGPTPLLSYLTSDWVDRVPLFEYSQEINQSLLAVLIRADGPQSADHPLERVDFLVGALLIAAITFAAVVRSRLAGRDALVLPLAVASALLVYPGVLRSYGLLLLVPLLLLLSLLLDRLRRPAAASGARVAGAGLRVPVSIAVGAGALFMLEHAWPFGATALVWLALCALAFGPWLSAAAGGSSPSRRPARPRAA